MVTNFWVDKRREKQFIEHGDKIAKRNKITTLEFKNLPKAKRVEMLEDYLKHLEKQAKKSGKTSP